jgi:hypothetical protein
MITQLLKLTILGHLFYATQAFSTIYIPTPLSDQIEDAHGVIRGVYKGKDYKKNSLGEVITEVSFSLKETSGLKPGDIINKNNFKVTFPGGLWQGINHKYSGSPEFKKNEDVVLLINKGPNGFHLLNFGLGKYSVVKDGNGLMLQSSVFPRNPKISGIPLKTFQQMVSEKFGHPLSQNKGDKFVYIPKGMEKNKSSRAPASIEEVLPEDSNSKKNRTMFWLMIILSVLGTLSYRLFNRKG